MNRAEIEHNIRELKKLRDGLSDPKQKRLIEENIANLEQQLSNLDKEANNRTTGQKIGSTVGRLGGMLVGMVAGEIETCVTGKDIKRTRGTYADGGESIGSAIGGAIERIAAATKRRRK